MPIERLTMAQDLAMKQKQATIIPRAQPFGLPATVRLQSVDTIKQRLECSKTSGSVTFRADTGKPAPETWVTAYECIGTPPLVAVPTHFYKVIPPHAPLPRL